MFSEIKELIVGKDNLATTPALLTPIESIGRFELPRCLEKVLLAGARF
ncbi:hypothetical protein NIES2111_29220 [Nostoc sp. NIES-2111]|jgi:hypothetical protein|nr:hypothetical protein NIES2111_29220 [Nostoc sp. NIES-2111]